MVNNLCKVLRTESDASFNCSENVILKAYLTFQHTFPRGYLVKSLLKREKSDIFSN